MESIAKLRAKLADQWGQLDADGDGKVEGAELVAAFDKNQDGVVDASEMEAMAKQLQEQSDYTAYLISQLQKMEEAQLAVQQEQKKKDAALRQTFAVADKARAEASELARRLEISQEVLQKMSQQCKEARVEAGSLRRETDRLRSECEQLRDAEARVRRENERLKQQRERQQEGESDGSSEGKNAQDAGAAAATTGDSAFDGRATRGVVASLQRQLDAATTAHSKAEAEVARLKLDMAAGQAALLQLGEETQRAKDDAAQAREDLVVAQQQLQQSLANKADAAASVGVVKQQLVDEQAKVALLQEQLASSRDQMALKDMELAGTLLVVALQQRIGEQTKQLRSYETEAGQLRRELEDVGADYLAQAKARAEEKDNAQRAVREAREERNRIAAEARRREKVSAQANASRNAAFRQQLLDSQAELERVQAELGAAQDRVAALQQEQSKAAGEFETALNAAHARCGQLQASLDDSTAKAAAAEAAAHEVIEALNTKLLDTRKSSIMLAEKHVASLAALQEALHALGGETAVSRDDFAHVVTTLTSLQRTVLSMNAQQHRPLEDWYSSVKKTFLGMMDAVTKSEELLEDARDEAANDAVRVEEARQDNLMLQERVSQLTHELASTDAKLRDAQEDGEHRSSTLQSELEDERALREALQKQVATTKRQLAEATHRVHRAQEDATVATSELSAKHAEHSSKHAELEAALAEARKEVRVKEQLYQAALAGKRAAEAKSGEASSSAAKAAEEQKTAHQALHDELLGVKAESKASRAQLAKMSKELARAHSRLQQTQVLLMTVREQKEQLEVRAQGAAAAGNGPAP